jgi:hypothetical protein
MTTIGEVSCFRNDKAPQLGWVGNCTFAVSGWVGYCTFAVIGWVGNCTVAVTVTVSVDGSCGSPSFFGTDGETVTVTVGWPGAAPGSLSGLTLLSVCSFAGIVQ